MAPFVPFITEAVHQNLVRAIARGRARQRAHGELAASATLARLDRALIAETDVVQRVVGLGRAARNSSKLKVRQPLARLLVRVPDEARPRAVRRHEDQILDELNVKKLELIARDATLVTLPDQAEPARDRQALRQADPGDPAVPGGRRTAPRSRPRSRAARRRRSRSTAERSRSSPPTCSSRARRPRASRARKRAAISSASTRRSTTSCGARGWRASSCAPCRTRASRRASRSPTASSCSSRATSASARRSHEHRDYVMSETLASTWRAPRRRRRFVAAQDAGRRALGHPARARLGGAMTRAALVLACKPEPRTGSGCRRRGHRARSVDEVPGHRSPRRVRRKSSCCRCSSSCGCTTKGAAFSFLSDARRVAALALHRRSGSS